MEYSTQNLESGTFCGLASNNYFKTSSNSRLEGTCIFRLGIALHSTYLHIIIQGQDPTHTNNVSIQQFVGTYYNIYLC